MSSNFKVSDKSKCNLPYHFKQSTEPFNYKGNILPPNKPENLMIHNFNLPKGGKLQNWLVKYYE